MMLGWAIKISIISILLIMIFHYSQFCFKQDVFAKQTATNDDLKVQKYKNIISALSKQSDLKQSDLKQSDLKQSDLKQSDLKQSNGKQSDPKQKDIDKNELVEDLSDMSMDLMDYLNQKTTLQIDNTNLDVVNLDILQLDDAKPKVLQQDYTKSEIIQLDITEINQ
jgi:uncharacterized protein YjbI with pentapeptide repeats